MGTTFVIGTAIMRRSGNRIVAFDFELRELTNGYGSTDDCFLTGFARSAQ